MNFQFYLEKLFDSDEFKKFKSENKDAFLCSGFFTVDKEGKDNQQHIDFWIPSAKKLFSFKLNENPIVAINSEIPGEFTPERIKDNINFDISEIESLIEKEMQKNNVNNRIQKIIISLQNNGEKDFLIMTVFLSNLGLLKIMFDIDEKKITGFEKKSFFDMMKFIGKKK